MLQQGQEVDRYIVEAHVGEGGMASVYRVRHATLGTLHALKVLSITTRDVRDRLIQEGRVQATLRHPNVVAVTDVLDINGAPGLLMEFIEGPALDEWLRNYRPTLDEALACFRGIVSGIGHAHARELIHRDLKPANIMLHIADSGIVPKVTDFGLAKLLDQDSNNKRTRTGTTMGTPAYMAPEQIRDASSVDRRADMYSLGCILYELVAGRPPFDQDDIIALFNAVANADYPGVSDFVTDLPPSISQCITGLMDVDTQRRIADCATVLRLLEGEEIDPTSFEGLDLTILPPPAPLPVVSSPTILPVEGTGAEVAKEIFDAARAASIVATPHSKPTWTDSIVGDGTNANVGAITRMAPPPAETMFQDMGDSLGPPLSTEEAVALHRRSTGTTALLLMVIALLATIVVGGGAAALWYVTRPDPVVVIATPPPEVELAPTPKPVTTPPPEPAEPTKVPPPEPTKAPPPEPAKAPPPSRPKPTPKPIKPTPPPAPSPSGGTIAFGGAKLLWVESASGKKYRSGNDIPPGSYEIKALFEGQPAAVSAGRVTIRKGKTSTIKCIAAMLQCK